MSTLASRTVGESGPRVVFLHGLFGQGRNWHTIALRLAERGYRVTTVDLPNHGRSPWTETQDYGVMAEEVAELLAELGEPVTLVGHSMGGKAAMTLALRRPELLTALVVVDISPVSYPAERSGSDFDRFLTAMRAMDLAALTSRSDADKALSEAVPDPTVRGFLLQSLVRDREVGWRWRLNLDVLHAHLADLGRFPEPPEGAVFDKPVLWIAGAESGYVREDNRAAMTALFPRTRLVRVKGAGHWVHSEQPDTFLSALAQFLDDAATG
ncbi:alpha/beta fold hydrolase [Rhodococcus sp. X156]|uniref:alpha/beta fold hydrolase n=1 Tax=Rhodococcus sp. X156 TaxID=2499145 RepID=UPI000FD84FB9|nr:alpha/beta fold hydrolase [Rhodococcus sp. X156]